MVLGCLAALATARAQDQEYLYDTGVTGRLVWNLGGTLAIPVGASAGRANVGGGFTVGLTYNPRPTFGGQFEYGANWSTLKTGKLSGVGIGGHALMQYFNLNGVVHPVRHGRTGFYLLGGGGLYYRGVDVTKATGTAVVPYCDPWLFYCSATPVTTSAVLGSRSRWDWGLDAGLGFTFGLSPPARLYLEVRYHYIFGPSFTASDGSKRTADGQLVPLTVGIQF
jgi:hypothetical protein